MPPELEFAVGIFTFFVGLLFFFGVVAAVTWAAWDTVQRCREPEPTDPVVLGRDGTDDALMDALDAERGQG